MRLTLDPRARALLARVPRTRLVAVPELLLLGVLALQAARLAWAVVTPVGPVGDWRPVLPVEGAAVRPDGFDPFFRLVGETAPAVVTSANLKLFGVRADMVSGRGAAILQLPDGTQASFVVGDEVLPGVRLDAVRLDGVTLLRGGAREQLFLDQSVAPSPTVVAAPPAGAPPIVSTVAPPPSSAPIQSAVSASPRVQDGRITGFTLAPNGDGAAFRAAGLEPGDVLLRVNGQPVGEGGAGSLPGLLAAGNATIEVDRGGRTVTLSIPAPAR
ncbi:type II secretion system protein N [Sphingomonas jatrophae]|uniref:General secretion pathway protein C n=1 Tax=Sphingomonas jatrophae TaxID=1166337 RepID=A0A1I6JCZ7_9SPHN|nr:type II secretion system protein N [Sphingomonas jatrophae]SFR76831.1 general secretion pathway protein C [Sphingomonas jatrophae]